MKSNHTRHYVHRFDNLNDAPFAPTQYSRLKFGSVQAAKSMGIALANDFFQVHAAKLISNRCVIIPSPYNYVPNAATMLTKHFIDRLNYLLVMARGEPVEYTLIHRKVSYTNDYGFLSKEKRKQLIDNDQFFFNREFIKGKLLIFIDDVHITGTHEQKLIEIMDKDGITNESIFLYFARYYGNDPAVEAAINFAAIPKFEDYIELVNTEECKVIVRPIKYILSQPSAVIKATIRDFPKSFVDDLVSGCMAEGYFKIPKFQSNFNIIVDEHVRRNV